MKGLFYLSGILLTLAAKMLIGEIRNKKRTDILIGSAVLTLSSAYAIYYFYVD